LKLWSKKDKRKRMLNILRISLFPTTTRKRTLTWQILRCNKIRPKKSVTNTFRSYKVRSSKSTEINLVKF
jgi:hypothetical protein